MSDPKSESSSVSLEPIKVTRGEPFLLLSSNRPFSVNEYGQFEQAVQTDDGQRFEVRFDDKKLDEEWHKWIFKLKDARVVLFTKDGPVDILKAGGTAERLMNSEHYYFHGVWSNSKNSKFKLILPRAEVVYGDHFLRAGSGLFADFEPKDSEGEIQHIFFEKNPEFLHQVKAQID